MHKDLPSMVVAAAAGVGLVVALSARAEPPKAPSVRATPVFVPHAPNLDAHPEAQMALAELEAAIQRSSPAELSLDELGREHLLTLAADTAAALEGVGVPALEHRFESAEGKLVALGVLSAG